MAADHSSGLDSPGIEAPTPLLPSGSRPLCLVCVGQRQNMALSIVAEGVSLRTEVFQYSLGCPDMPSWPSSDGLGPPAWLTDPQHELGERGRGVMRQDLSQHVS